jgi:hypothetical protein
MVMLSVIIMNVVLLSVIKLNVVMLSVIMLSVIMLSVIMLNVTMLSVEAPQCWPDRKNKDIRKNRIVCQSQLKVSLHVRQKVSNFSVQHNFNLNSG